MVLKSEFIAFAHYWSREPTHRVLRNEQRTLSQFSAPVTVLVGARVGLHRRSTLPRVISLYAFLRQKEIGC